MGIFVGSAEAFDCGIYPEAPKSFTNYISQQVTNLANTGIGLSQQFIDMTKTMYNKYNNEAILAVAKQVALSANMLFDMNIIQALLTIEAIQLAKPMMQRYIMALPEITVLHNEQRIESYYGSFKDAEPGAVGIDRQDYRTITNGLYQEREDGSRHWTIHYDVPDEDEVPLTFRDRMDIMDTWDVALQAIAQGIDPTSITGEKIQG